MKRLSIAAGFVALTVSQGCTGTISGTETNAQNTGDNATDTSNVGGNGEQAPNNSPSSPGAEGSSPATAPTWQGVACKADKPGPRLMRRLTGSQYDNTIADLLGVQSKLGAAFVAAATVEGFSNNARALQVDPLLAEQLDTAASSLAADAIKNIAGLTQGCTEPTQTCADAFIAKFGKRAYRRPLTAAESGRYSLAYKIERDAGESHAVGLETVLAALLQSPGFLYRSERGTVQGNVATLDNYEVASELSFLLTDSMPDQALFEAADQGKLKTAVEIEGQARRLLATPRGRQAMSRFVQAWLQVDRLSNAPKDATMFPMFNDGLRNSLQEGLGAYVQSIAFGETPTFKALLSAPYTMLDDKLTAVYGDSFGKPASGSTGFAKTMKNGSGLLAQPAVMATHAAPAHTSPVHRGRMVRERIFCEEIPPPPPNVSASLPPVDVNLPLRQRLAAHVANPSCVACHRLLDDAGLAFEGYDAIGRHRTKEDNGAIIDTSGTLYDLGGQNMAVADAAALSVVASNSSQAQGCFARQWTTFAIGLGITDADECVLGDLLTAFPKSPGNLVELIIQTVTSAHFRTRSAS